MKKLIKIIIASLILLILTGCENTTDEFKEVLEVGGNDNLDLRNYSSISDTTTIYSLYDSVKYEGKELKDIIKTTNIDDILLKMDIVSILNDGGSIIYQDGNHYIAKCNSLEDNGNNHNIYILNKKEYALNICTFNEMEMKNCLISSLRKFIQTKKVSVKDGKLEEITNNTNFDNLVYKKSKLGEFIIVKTSDGGLINELKNYFQKKNNKYIYESFKVNISEDYHVFFYNKNNSDIKDVIISCIK